MAGDYTTKDAAAATNALRGAINEFASIAGSRDRNHLK